MRMMPTLVSAFGRAHIACITAGDRHSGGIIDFLIKPKLMINSTAVILAPQPTLAKDDPDYKPYLQILKEVCVKYHVVALTSQSAASVVAAQ
jgi:hypothetical protein